MKYCIPRLENPLAYLAGESGYSYKKWSTHKTSSIFGINKTANHQRLQDFCYFMTCLFSLRPKAHRFVVLWHFKIDSESKHEIHQSSHHIKSPRPLRAAFVASVTWLRTNTQRSWSVFHVSWCFCCTRQAEPKYQPLHVIHFTCRAWNLNNYRLRSKGDYMFGSVRPSVRPSVDAQNQPSIILKGRITNPHVCLFVCATSFCAFADDHAFNFGYFPICIVCS